ncbi:type II toxin-antitoxin system HicA family toxin [Maribacter sp. 2304DJ31-5]|uniref:type II toxin-antitoxin system HicA family toxin n=1 Tax=Maribacter sp. 2304DJ31-5 TaxID=3386273 RepID=UPI0039BC7874
MSKIEKLLLKFRCNPKDLTWNELVKILNHYGFVEISKKGKTGGSRVKFCNDNKDIINLHKPHPSNIVKQYVIKQIIEKLKLWRII